MAAFPSLNYTTDSRIETGSGFVHVRATNGALKSRQLFAADKRRFQLRFECSAAQRSQITGHYAGDRFNSFSFTDPATGAAYTVRYESPPQEAPQPGGWWVITVTLVEV